MQAVLLKTSFVPRDERRPRGNNAGDRIRQAREQKFPQPWSIEALAKQLDGSMDLSASKWLSRIKNYESGRSNPRDRDAYEAIAVALDIDLDWLLNGPDDRTVRWRTPSNALIVREHRSSASEVRVPYLGTVPRDQGLITEGGLRTVAVSNQIEDLTDVVTVRLTGKAMYPRLHPGAMLAVKKDPTKVDGSIVLVTNEKGAGTVGILTRVSQDDWELRFLDPNENPLPLNGWRVIGRVIHHEETNEAGILP